MRIENGPFSEAGPSTPRLPPLPPSRLRILGLAVSKVGRRRGRRPVTSSRGDAALLSVAAADVQAAGGGQVLALRRPPPGKVRRVRAKAGPPRPSFLGCRSRGGQTGAAPSTQPRSSVRKLHLGLHCPGLHVPSASPGGLRPRERDVLDLGGHPEAIQPTPPPPAARPSGQIRLTTLAGRKTGPDSLNDRGGGRGMDWMALLGVNDRNFAP